MAYQPSEHGIVANAECSIKYDCIVAECGIKYLCGQIFKVHILVNKAAVLQITTYLLVHESKARKLNGKNR